MNKYDIKYQEYFAEEVITNGHTDLRAHKNALERVAQDIELDKQKGTYIPNVQCSECDNDL